jgi:hypothetical protein
LDGVVQGAILHAEQQNYLRQMAAQPLNKRNPRLAWVWL